METTREAKRKAEQLHDAVAALDAHAHKARKTEAGRSAASKSSAAAEADAEKATKAAERAVEKAARLAAAATAWDAQLDAEQGRESSSIPTRTTMPPPPELATPVADSLRAWSRASEALLRREARPHAATAVQPSTTSSAP